MGNCCSTCRQAKVEDWNPEDEKYLHTKIFIDGQYYFYPHDKIDE